jgi:hypothetical protein
MSLVQFINAALLSFGPAIAIVKASPLYVDPEERRVWPSVYPGDHIK